MVKPLAGFEPTTKALQEPCHTIRPEWQMKLMCERWDFNPHIAPYRLARQGHTTILYLYCCSDLVNFHLVEIGSTLAYSRFMSAACEWSGTLDTRTHAAIYTTRVFYIYIRITLYKRYAKSFNVRCGVNSIVFSNE